MEVAAKGIAAFCASFKSAGKPAALAFIACGLVFLATLAIFLLEAGTVRQRAAPSDQVSSRDLGDRLGADPIQVGPHFAGRVQSRL